jgi:hypothetical protein
MSRYQEYSLARTLEARLDLAWTRTMAVKWEHLLDPLLVRVVSAFAGSVGLSRDYPSWEHILQERVK